MMQIERIRASLQRRLRGTFNEGLWNYLVHRGFVEEVVEDRADLDYLVEEARLIADTWPQPRAREAVEVIRSGGPAPGHERAWALSQLVVEHANGDPDVLAFRLRYLNNQLVRWAEFDDWLQRQSAVDGPLTSDVTVTVPAESLVRRGSGIEFARPIRRVQPYHVTARILDYALPGDKWVRRIGVAAHGCLDRLRILSDTIANAFAWLPAQATIFVVCGVPPLISIVRATSPGVKVRHDVDVAWARRITLNIDPAATPDEVLEAYRSVRRELGMEHLRPIGAKHARLAAFTGAEHADRPWAERQRLWNAKFPQWTYSNGSNFRRDALRAQTRLLYPGRLRVRV